MSDRDSRGWFLDAVRRGESLKDEVGVLLVVNVKGRTRPIDDYEGDSITTEFFSANELDNIIGYFESAGIYHEVVFDEQGFVKWIANKESPFPRRHLLVFNLAQNGTGPARYSSVPGICRLYGLPLLDCADPYSVAITQHKFHSLSLLSHFQIPVARSWSFAATGWIPDRPPEGTRLIAKLTYDSASIGLSQTNIFEMQSGYEEKLAHFSGIYRQPVTLQEFVAGFEVEVPVLETDSMPRTITAVGVELHGRRNLGDSVLTYQTVFEDNYAFYDFSEVNEATAQKALGIARAAYRALGLSGMARVDFRIREGGSPLIMEVNSKPQIAQHSSVIYALRSIAQSGSDLMKFFVGRAAARYGLSH